jgi:molecular chaperone GrpE
MDTDRKQQASTFTPGEPEAPVAGSTPPPPAPAERGAPVERDAPADPDAPAERGAPEQPNARLPGADEDELAAIAVEEPEDRLEPAPGPGQAVTDGARQAVDLDALTAKAEKADEYLQLAQRTKADFENYRKRAIREAAAAQDRGVAKLAMELLPAVDNLDRALEAAAAGDGSAEFGNGSSLVSGIRLVHADVIAALARVGIEPFSPRGEQFDPQHHEAIAQQPVDGAAAGTVVEVYQRGYRLGENVLRPARVVVAQ